MRTLITRKQYLQVVGLLSLSAKHNKMISEIEMAVAQILRQPDEGCGYYGHVSDAVGEVDPSADKLLAMCEIEVESDE